MDSVYAKQTRFTKIPCRGALGSSIAIPDDGYGRTWIMRLNKSTKTALAALHKLPFFLVKLVNSEWIMARYLITFVKWTILTSAGRVQSRLWKEIELIHDMYQPNKDGTFYLETRELKLLNESPYRSTGSPAIFTTNSTRHTLAPSPSPSNGPTIIPTVAPSDSPSGSPTHQPSDSPSERPSAVPTLDPYPRNNVLNVNQQGYFNYDQSPKSEFGPANWGNVRLPDTYYWDEFGENGYGPWRGALSKRAYRENLCERGQKHQSPIDVYETALGCSETHEIRDHNGDFQLSDTRVDKRIEPNKLRLIFPRRPCPDINSTKCQFPHPPWADFPNGFKGIADVIHIDFKIPSEHWLRGESFDGEMQVYHLHLMNARLVAVSSLVRATSQGHNPHFQLALDAFQDEYNKNQATCAKHRNVNTDYVPPIVTKNSAGMTSITNATRWNNSAATWSVNENSTHTTSTNPINNANTTNLTNSGRNLHNILGAWDPYDPSIMPTIYFYRYDGSITEPPCSEIVSWFINDTPMIISVAQLEQWRMIQFTNIDPKTCQSTSVHSGRSVARPIKRPMASDRVVTRCTSSNFSPDPTHSTK
jgi:carbonic anhydrase